MNVERSQKEKQNIVFITQCKPKTDPWVSDQFPEPGKPTLSPQFFKWILYTKTTKNAFKATCRY